MNGRDRLDIRRAIEKLRSGDIQTIIAGERQLMRIANIETTGCSCEDYPSVLSRKCGAHTYIVDSVLEAKATGGTSLRDIAVMIRKQLGAKA